MIVGFDIDGTLTEDVVLDSYKTLSKNKELTVGIVTRRYPQFRDVFIEKNKLETDFRKSAIIKSRAFKQIENQFKPDQSPTYVGNRITDNIYSSISGWRFVSAQSVNSSASILE